MMNYIVLGQVPGTSYYLSFASVLIMYAAVFVLAIIIGARHLVLEPPEPIKILPPDKQHRSFAEFLPAAYVSLAVWIIVRCSRASQKRLENYLLLRG